MAALLAIPFIGFAQQPSDTVSVHKVLDEVNVNALRANEKTPVAFTIINEAEIEKGNLGQKTGAGFYKKDVNGNILVLDLDNKNYRPIEKIKLGLDNEIIQHGAIDQRINALIALDSINGDLVGKLVRLRYGI